MKTIIASLCTLLLLSFIISTDGFAQPKQKFHGKNFKNNMMEKLNLTPEQQDKISELRTNHQKEMIDLRADLQKQMVDMKALKENPDLKRAELISAVEKMNGIKNQMAVAKANHRMDVYELLNADQKKIWQEHKPFRDQMKMKSKDRDCGLGKFDREDFGAQQDFDDDELVPSPDVN